MVGLAKACEISNFESSEVTKIMNYLESKLVKKFDCEIIGKETKRSPYISNVIFIGMDADVIIGKLKHTIVSNGSACTSEINEPSHVLKSMGIQDEKAFGSIRFSISKYTSINEIDLAIEELAKVSN